MKLNEVMCEMSGVFIYLFVATRICRNEALQSTHTDTQFKYLLNCILNIGISQILT